MSFRAQPSRAVLSLAWALTLVLAAWVAKDYVRDGRSPAAAVGEPTTLSVELREFAITPVELQAPAGAPLRIEVRNAGAIMHNLAVEGAGTTEDFPGGQRATLELPPLEEGAYKLLCTIPGHEAAGMAATLTVGGDGAVAHDHADHALGAEEMARMHVEGVKAFPAPTEGRGNQLLAPVSVAGGVAEYHLTADEISWETKPGVRKDGMAFNGMIPGPRIEGAVGDTIRVVLHNKLDDAPTAAHFHGLLVPNDMDGVPGITQDPVMPGETFTYEFTLRNAGSHMYHSHFDAAVQVPMGLLGAIVVRDGTEEPVDVDEVMVLNDGPLGFTINGKDFPATQPVVAALGQKVRIRYMNEGLQIHPMHLHGMAQRVVARDGYPLPQPYLADTVLVGPGERIDVVVEATEPGVWAFHCHILNHAEAADGMFGMVTALIVEE